MAPITKATQKRLEAAVVAFNARYAADSQWGEQRWVSSLLPALAQPTTYTAVINQYAVDEEEALSILSEADTGILRRVNLPPIRAEIFEQRQEQDIDLLPEIICFERTPADRTCSNGSKVETATSSSAASFPAPKPVSSTGSQLMTHWNMDAASVLAAHLLDVRPGDRVLDMCAAPGGKSVVLAQKLFPHLHHGSSTSTLGDSRIGILHANEVDPNRYKRLSTNLKSYLDPSLFHTPENPQAPVKILNKDLSTKQSAPMLPLGVDGYDKILVDAPCSSERHIIHAYEKAKISGQVADEMLNWKSSHVATLTKTQTGLLCTALRAVKLGGRVVYATCALGEEENDGVIARVLDVLKTERKKGRRDGRQDESWDIQFQMGIEGTGADDDDRVLDAMTERTRFGRIALPDRGGWGPLYFCIMFKTVRTKKHKHASKNSVSAPVLHEKNELRLDSNIASNVDPPRDVEDLHLG